MTVSCPSHNYNAFNLNLFVTVHWTKAYARFLRGATHKTGNLWTHHTRLICFYSISVAEAKPNHQSWNKNLNNQTLKKTPKQPNLPHLHHFSVWGKKCSRLFALHNVGHGLTAQEHHHTLMETANNHCYHQWNFTISLATDFQVFKASKDFTLSPLHGKRRLHAHGAAGAQGPVDPHILAAVLSQRQVDGTFPCKRRTRGELGHTRGSRHRQFPSSI